MIDMTNNRVPFGLLTGKERHHLDYWPHGLECWSKSKGWQDFTQGSGPLRSCVYRTKPAPKPLREFWLVNQSIFATYQAAYHASNLYGPEFEVIHVREVRE
ncbi:MAG: hypothetical protein ACOH2M_28255 [Cypionkella sp.]